MERGGNRGKKRPFETPSTIEFDDILEEEERDEATKERLCIWLKMFAGHNPF